MDIITIETGSEDWFARQSAGYLGLSNQSIVVFTCDEKLMDKTIALIKKKLPGTVRVDCSRIVRTNKTPMAIVHRKGYIVERITPKVKKIPLVAQIVFTLDDEPYRLVETQLVGL